MLVLPSYGTSPNSCIKFPNHAPYKKKHNFKDTIVFSDSIQLTA